MTKVHLVITGSQIRKNVEAAFFDKEIASAFAKGFPTGRVQEMEVHDTFPPIYKHEVWMEKDTGDIIETNESLPSLDSFAVETSDGLIYAVGSSIEDAEVLAEELRQSLFPDPI